MNVAEENENVFASILLQEGVKQHESLFRIANDITEF